MMTRCENLIESINGLNKNDTSFEELLLFLLTDIAMSLAVIADEAKVDKKDDQ